MTKPIPVVLVQPRSSGRGAEVVLTLLFDYFGGAWLAMLLLPVFTPWNLSYWQALALVAFLRLCVPNVDGFHLLLFKKER